MTEPELALAVSDFAAEGPIVVTVEFSNGFFRKGRYDYWSPFFPLHFSEVVVDSPYDGYTVVTVYSRRPATEDEARGLKRIVCVVDDMAYQEWKNSAGVPPEPEFEDLEKGAD